MLYIITAIEGILTKLGTGFKFRHSKVRAVCNFSLKFTLIWIMNTFVHPLVIRNILKQLTIQKNEDKP